LQVDSAALTLLVEISHIPRNVCHRLKTVPSLKPHELNCTSETYPNVYFFPFPGPVIFPEKSFLSFERTGSGS
jgi:hypothetical protein